MSRVLVFALLVFAASHVAADAPTLPSCRVDALSPCSSGDGLASEGFGRWRCARPSR